MSQYMDILDWSTAKVEPFSPVTANGDFWLLNDDSVSNPELLVSLPLSLIQEDKNATDKQLKYEENIVEYILSNTSSPGPASPQQQYLSGESSPLVKYEDTFISPAQSPSPSTLYSGNNSPNDRSSRAQLASQLLVELDGYKEEPLSDWFEEKIDLPIFEDFSTPKESVQDTQSLLQEFESLCGTIGVHNVPHFAHLTPPQSPPEVTYPIQHVIPAEYIPVQQAILPTVETTSQPQPEDNTFDWHLNVPLEQINLPDISKEFASVDDIVYRAALNISWPDKEPTFVPVPNVEITGADLITENEYSQDLGKVDDDTKMQVVQETYDQLSYDNEYATSNEDSTPSPSSPASSSCSTYGSSENDDEWIGTYSSKSPKNKNSSRSKPYARGSEDKKSRKKEQNKNAATRYRQKKKAEVEILLDEEKILLDKNTDLRSRHTDLKREVKYLKSLLRELLKSKGVSI